MMQDFDPDDVETRSGLLCGDCGSGTEMYVLDEEDTETKYMCPECGNISTTMSWHQVILGIPVAVAYVFVAIPVKAVLEGIGTPKTEMVARKIDDAFGRLHP